MEAEAALPAQARAEPDRRTVPSGTVTGGLLPLGHPYLTLALPEGCPAGLPMVIQEACQLRPVRSYAFQAIAGALENSDVREMTRAWAPRFRFARWLNCHVWRKLSR